MDADERAKQRAYEAGLIQGRREGLIEAALTLQGQAHRLLSENAIPILSDSGRGEAVSLLLSAVITLRALAHPSEGTNERR